MGSTLHKVNTCSLHLLCKHKYYEKASDNLLGSSLTQ